MESSFPKPNIFRVTNKGEIFLSNSQWNWFANYLKASTFSLKYQRAMIKAFFCGCLESYIKKNNSDKKLNKRKKKKK